MPRATSQTESPASRVGRAIACLAPLATFVMLAAPALAQSGEPGLRLEATRVDLGESYQFGVLEHEIRLTNGSSREINVLAVEPQDERGSGIANPQTIPPGGEALLALTQPLGSELGVRSFAFRIETDDLALPEQQIELATFIQSAYDAEYPRLDFGDVNATTGKTVDFEIATREAPTLEFTRVVAAPEWVSVDTTPADPDEPQKVALRFKIKPGAPFGWQSEVIHVQTDLPHQRDYLIPFTGSIFGDVVPTIHPIGWGAVRQGEPRPMSIQLVSRSGGTVTVERIEESTGRVRVAEGPCDEATAGPSCRQLDLVLAAERLGGVRGVVQVWIAGIAQPLPLSYNGLVVSPDADIQSLGQIDADTRINRSGVTKAKP